MHDGVSLLAGWESFYVMIGSSSGALTGLMFVVVTLMPGTRVANAEDGIATFSTPTVVHFCAALLVSAILMAPWTALSQAAVALGIVGAAGLLYVVIVTRRAHRQTAYVPVFEDWLWHVFLPFAAYAVFCVAALAFSAAAVGALFAVGAASVLLLFIGIHNAWDTVTYLALERLKSRAKTNHPIDL